MTQNEFGTQTLTLIKDLQAKGITKMSVMMRHSARYYDRGNPGKEPFLGLTEEGKQYSYDFGKRLPRGLTIKPFSSTYGRCIETAYLIDKGYTAQGGSTVNNRVDAILSPSYVKKPFQLGKVMQKEATDFIRFWFDGNIPEEIIEVPEKAAWNIVDFLAANLTDLSDNQVSLSVSHDWNMYLVKEQCMGLVHEEVGGVEYLESVVVYEEDNQRYLANHQCDPVTLNGR